MFVKNLCATLKPGATFILSIEQKKRVPDIEAHFRDNFSRVTMRYFKMRLSDAFAAYTKTWDEKAARGNLPAKILQRTIIVAARRMLAALETMTQRNDKKRTLYLLAEGYAPKAAIPERRFPPPDAKQLSERYWKM